MNISGILVTTKPEQTESVKARLLELTGVEVHICSNDGHIVVTAEEHTVSQSGEMFNRINRLDGVLSATLTYHHLMEEEEYEGDTA